MDNVGNHLRDSLVKLALEAKSMDLPFLLVGGNALIHYGLPRFTRDIDLLVPESSASGWKELLEKSGLDCFHRTDAFLQFVGDKPGLAPVDLMVVGTETWEKLLAAAGKAEFAPGLDLWLPSPLHLIAMKLQAYRAPSRSAREQDWSDIMHLVVQFVPDIFSTGFGDLVLRHGGEAAWQRLRSEFHPDSP